MWDNRCVTKETVPSLKTQRRNTELVSSNTLQARRFACHPSADAQAALELERKSPGVLYHRQGEYGQAANSLLHYEYMPGDALLMCVEMCGAKHAETDGLRFWGGCGVSFLHRLPAAARARTRFLSTSGRLVGFDIRRFQLISGSSVYKAPLSQTAILIMILSSETGN